MPDGTAGAAATLRSDALSAVDLAVAARGGWPLSYAEMSAYSARTLTHAWRLPVQFPNCTRHFDILADPQFPRSPVKIAVVERPPFLTWSHVEFDGVLCLLNGASTVNPYAPWAAVETLLGDACGLIEDLVAGRLSADFRDEFLSYWGWADLNEDIHTLSLLKPCGPSRAVRIWRGGDLHLLGETDEQLDSWLICLKGTPKQGNYQFEAAALLWRDEPLTPSEFPYSGAGLLEIADATGRDVLLTLAAHQPNRLIAAIGASSAHGVCFGAVTLDKPPRPARGGGNRATLLESGFRPGHAPASIIGRRFLAGAGVSRNAIERVDGAWIHGRGQDERQALTERSTVTILGCGSVGGAVAVLLAQAGIGRIRLVDDDRLKAANVSRHQLGILALGRNKAIGLKEHLSKRFPHLVIEAVSERWENLPADFGLFTQSDLIISTMGDWASEGALNAAHIQSGRSTPILYGWTEAHAVAGHAVMIGHKAGCLQCGFDVLGRPSLTVFVWPDGAPWRQEPACGAVYQPYGAVDLASTVSLIAEFAVDTLVGTLPEKEHRVWVASERRVATVGAVLSDGFQAQASQHGSGSAVYQLSWSVRSDCPACQAQAVAA